MAPSNLPGSRVVNFGSVITPQGIQAPAFNTGLVLGTSPVIDVVSRIREYATLAEIAADFGTSAQEYLSAQVWFDQNPQPTSMYVGRWANANTAGQLIGGPVSAANQLLSAWTVITTGSLKIAVDGGSLTNVTGLNFSSAPTLPGVAALIQTGIQALAGNFALVTCVWNSVYQNFVITSGTTGTDSAVAFLTAAGSGTDITAMMACLSTSPGAYVANGIAAQTFLATVELFDNQFGGLWYHLFGPSAVDTDSEAVGPYIDGDNTPHFYWINTQEAGVLTPGGTTNIGYYMQQLATNHAAIQYSSTSLYAAWSMAARIATVNWEGSNTAISLMYKQEPDIVAENLTANQANAIDGYNVNVYANYGGLGTSGTPIIEQGICPSGQFVDTIVGVDWLRSMCVVNVFNLLLSQSTKIPQTDAGANTIMGSVVAACEQGITNGLGAPGVWNASGFGTLIEGQTLDSGYYVYIASIATQTEAERELRVCPPIQVAFKLAGAINTVSGTIFVNN